MQNNYYFLKNLSKELVTEIKGLKLAACFSQNRDELVLGFCTPHREFWIKAMLTSDIACLSFPKEYARAKKNSVNLFQELLDLEVLAIQQYQNERSFSIEFENNYTLLFKMHGRSSNIILFESKKFLASFNNRFEQDKKIDLTNLDRPILQNQNEFEQQGIRKTFPTFGKVVISHLELQDLDLTKQWQKVDDLLQSFKKPTFYVLRMDNSIAFRLFEAGEVLFSSQNAIESINQFYTYWSKEYYLEKERQKVIKNLQRQSKQYESYLKKTKRQLDKIQNESRYEEMGHILMANLNQIPKRAKEVELLDFYTNQLVKIALKEKLSPQKNAENYYRKSKNQKIEIKKLKQNFNKKEEQLIEIACQIEEIVAFDRLKDLRKYLKKENISSNKKQNQEVSLFKTFTYQGFQILVGKSAANNDILTQKHAYKEDLWLHARGVSGSHVVIKYQSGKVFPKNVIEKAAQLAAYYSKRKTDTLCPVIYTPKKFVRKPKGYPAGAVVVDRENVLMIEPMAF